ncbi:phosphohydrolase [Pectobacteriaceae bacterium CE90]|nr:phosphohydrolase [Pectobacteriaceae bacterium CE90]
MDFLSFEQDLSRYIAQRLANSKDGAHDYSHLVRVVNNARRIQQTEGGDLRVIITASYLHDIISLPKNHPERKNGSRMAAEETLRILRTEFPYFPVTLYSAVSHAVAAHSYSAGITPETLEAKIVQDADRLDSLGALGLARVFYVAGLMERPLFESQDPFAFDRPLDDQSYTLDHFRVKLLGLPQTMHTVEGKRIARGNAAYLVDFLAKLAGELGADPLEPDAEVRERLFLLHP